MRCVKLECFKFDHRDFNKMDNAEVLKGENANEQNASRKKDNITENISGTKKQEFEGVIKSEGQSKYIFEEKDVKYHTDDPQTKPEQKNDQQAEVLVEHDEGKLGFSSMNRKRKVMEDKTVSCTNPVKIQKKTQCGQDEKDGRQKRISLRRRVLLLNTRKKYCSKLTSKSIESQSNFQKLQDKASRISDEETKNNNLRNIDKNSLSFKSSQFQFNFQNVHDKKSRIYEGTKKTKNNILGNIDINSSFLNQFQHTSSNKSQEVWSNVKKHSFISLSPPPHSFSTLSQTQNVRSGIEVWEHFKKFLHRNKESFDRIMIDDIGKDGMETSDNANHSLNDTRKTKEFACLSLGEPVETKTENASNEMEDSLNFEVAEIRNGILMTVLEKFEKIRYGFLKQIVACEKLLLIKKVDSQQDIIIEEKVKYLNVAEKAQQRIHKIFDVFCGDEKAFEIIKDLRDSNNPMNNLSNITNLIDLPLLARNIRTFSSFFLYQYKSLYFDVPIENVFKFINVNNCVSAYRKYKNLKAKLESEKEKSEKEVNKLLIGFHAHLEQFLLIFKNEILNSENESFKDDKKYINNLKLRINENLDLMNQLLSVASSLVFPVAVYLKESRKITLTEFDFLSKRRPDVFSLLAKIY